MIIWRNKQDNWRLGGKYGGKEGEIKEELNILQPGAYLLGNNTMVAKDSMRLITIWMRSKFLTLLGTF